MEKLRSLLLIGLSLSLSACTWTWRQQPDTRFHRFPGTMGTGAGAHAATVGIQGGTIGSTTVLTGVLGGMVGVSKTKIMHHLALEGVKVIVIGDHTRIILPSDKFFEPDSDELLPDHLAVLDDVARLIHRDNPTRPISVVGHTDNLLGWRHSRHLSYRQAQRICSYLWTQNVDQHELYPLGMGKEMDVATNRNLKTYLANRRIEISY